MSEAADQSSRIAIYAAYVEDLGRIGSRHESARKYYVSVISALFVFLSMAGADGPFANVRGSVMIVVAFVGMIVCLAWFEHMRSFGMIYAAKFHTLRQLEGSGDEGPFTVETRYMSSSPAPAVARWRYTPLTFVDGIVPVAGILLFIVLPFVK
jgi:hypothetical protein